MLRREWESIPQAIALTIMIIINLTEEVKNTYNGNIKMLQKEIGEDSR